MIESCGESVTVAKSSAQESEETFDSFDATSTSGGDVMLVSMIEIDGKHECLKYAVPVPVVLDEESGLWNARSPALGIDAWAKTRPDLSREIHEELEVLFAEYAFEPDESLTPAAQRLKKRLLYLIGGKQRGN